MGLFATARVVATMPELQRPKPIEPEGPQYVCGLDLGMMSDYTALAILEKTTQTRPDGKRVNHYAVRHLQRWLHVDYPTIAEDLRPLLAALPKPELAVDGTGVGIGVVQILRRAKLPISRLVPITITAGHATTEAEMGGYNVPKRELVASGQSALQGKRLVIAPQLKEAKTLRKELQTFKVKITLNATESFEAWRSGDHDDLCLAVLMAVWLADRPQMRLTADRVYI